MKLDIWHFILSHALWIVASVILFFAVSGHLNDLKNLAAADQRDKDAQHEVDYLNDQIKSRDGQLSALKDQAAARDKQTQAQIAAIAKLINQPKTPEQVIQSLPVVTDVPLNARTIPNSAQIAVDAQPLFTGFAACKQQSLSLDACKQDLVDQKKVAEILARNIDDQKAVIQVKDETIKSYAKAAGHKSFWGKVWDKTQQVGLVVIGAAIGKML